MHSLNFFLQDVGSGKSVSCIVWENTLPSICILKRLHISIYIYIYISVAKPYGRFGQKLESLQAGQVTTGQGKTGQERAGQRDRSKAGRAKVEQSVGKKQGRA